VLLAQAHGHNMYVLRDLPKTQQASSEITSAGCQAACTVRKVQAVKVRTLVCPDTHAVGTSAGCQGAHAQGASVGRPDAHAKVGLCREAMLRLTCVAQAFHRIALVLMRCSALREREAMGLHWCS